MATSCNWDANQYLLFAEERTRAARDLLGQVQMPSVSTAVDLGCGPGNSTALLKERWPAASVIGIDNSVEMLKKAQESYPNLAFLEADIRGWSIESPVDLLFSNATLQWLENHRTLFPHLLEQVRTDGVLAIQMPANHASPAHHSMRQLAVSGPWSNLLPADLCKPTSVQEPEFYYDILSPLSQELDIWETVYFHVLSSIQDVVQWLRGTGLRPFLAHLSESQQKEFLAQFHLELTRLHPKHTDGKVLLPYRRLFMVIRH